MSNSVVPVDRERHTEDWRKSASELLMDFVRNKTKRDVVFTFENFADRIEAHQLVLRSRSSVFESMFKCSPDSAGKITEVRVDLGITPEVMKKFVEFLYSDTIEATHVEALHLLHLAKKYKLRSLSKSCVTLLYNPIPMETCVTVYETADGYGYDEISKKSAKVILSSFKELLMGQHLLAAKEATLIKLLKRSDLKVREIELFQFVLRWGQQAAGTDDTERLREVLVNILPTLRLTNMKADEFTHTVLPTGLVHDNEAVQFYAYFHGDNATKKALASKFKYKTSCRCGDLDEKFEFYETDVIWDDGDRKLLTHIGEPLRECISFNVKGVNSTIESCSYFMFMKTLSKVQIKSIQVQWPRLLSGEGDEQRPIHYFLMEKTSTDREFRPVFQGTELESVLVDATDIPIDPPVEVRDQTEYCVAIYDPMCFIPPKLYTHRYAPDHRPCEAEHKAVINGRCLRNVKISNVQRNACPKAKCENSSYEGIHVIRGVHLECTHNNPLKEE